MSLRLRAVVALIVAVPAILVASSGSAYHGNWCDYKEGPLNPNSWMQTAFSYTDYSYWDDDDGKGYTAERHSTGGITYFLDKPSGGNNEFDNGSTSPWRKQSYYNWNQTQPSHWQVQMNDNGTCL